MQKIKLTGFDQKNDSKDLLDLLELHLEQSVSILARLVNAGNSSTIVLRRYRIRGALSALSVYERAGLREQAGE